MEVQTLDHAVERDAGQTIRGYAEAGNASGATFNEAQIVGFRLLRQTDDGASQPIPGELIPAQHAGANQGAAYAITDAPAPGVYTYVLEVIQADGQRVRAATTTAQVAAPAAPRRLFLPLVAQAAP